MKINRAARLTARLLASLRDGTAELTVSAQPADRRDGFHGLFERPRPKFLQRSLGPARSLDSFMRETDELSFPDDLVFYRGVSVAAHSHIDHLLDDLGYRLAKTSVYKGRGKFWATTEEKLCHLEHICAGSGPMAPYSKRIHSFAQLVRRFGHFRNLMVHGEFGLHVDAFKRRLVGVRKFGKPNKQSFNDQGALLSIEHISRRAASLDRLARHADRLHFELCKHLSLPSGLMEIQL